MDNNLKWWKQNCVYFNHCSDHLLCKFSENVKYFEKILGKNHFHPSFLKYKVETPFSWVAENLFLPSIILLNIKFKEPSMVAMPTILVLRRLR